MKKNPPVAIYNFPNMSWLKKYKQSKRKRKYVHKQIKMESQKM